MTATPRLRLRRLAKSFGATPVLAGVDLDIAPGEFCVFVGPSGCGKSTLLRLVAGLDEPTAGDIDIDARTVTGLPPSQRDVAMVFQGYALYPHMSAFDNMAFGLAHRLPKSEIVQRVHEAARLLQLGELLQRRPRELSGGQRQRVAIGRAIVRRPKVFLFDEPLSNLDAALRASTRVELARLHRGQGDASMVYVTHDQVEAMTLADRIVLLRPLGAGHSTSVAQVGPPLSLYHRPADRFVAGFIGSPGMNFMAALALEAGPGGLVASVGDQRWPTHADAGAVPRGAPLTLGVRPEHVRVGAGAARARVVHVERLGEHSVVHLQAPGTGNANLLAKSTRDDVAVDDVLSYDLPPAALHVFGPDGRAVRRLGESA